MKINLPLKYILLSFFGVVLISSFASAQMQEWVAIYNDTANLADEANMLYVDANGNSYAGGYSNQNMAVVKCNSSGTRLWTAIDTTYTGSADAMTVDAKGDVFLTGYVNNYSGSSYDVVKFDSMGVFQWAKYMGSSIQDRGMAITSDANFVYVTGYVPASSFPPYNNFRTVKLDIATGATQSGWPQDYNGIGNNSDVPTSIAVDNSGNVFVTGSSVNSSGDEDYLTIGYNASGSMLTGWPQSYNGTGDSDDVPVQILLSGNNVYVTGASQGIGSSWDILTIVYTYSGALVSGWPQRYNGTGNGWDGDGSTENSASYKPMAVDGSGNVYVTGWTTNTSGNYDIITFMYNAAGVIQSGWPQIYDNGGNQDISRGLALDASNDVCITGFTGGTLYNADYVTIEYDPSGATMTGWPVIYSGTANGDDQAQAIMAVGSNIWITGYATDNGASVDITTIKYTNSNLTVGVKSLPSSYNDDVIYPNPTSGMFTLHNSTGESQLTILNTLGEIIYQSKVISMQAQVDLSNETKGIYFYKIIGENNVAQQGKLILL